MSLTKSAILLFVILVGMPFLFRWLERKRPLDMSSAGNEEDSFCPFKLSSEDCEERFLTMFSELSQVYGQSLWMLVKPTITLLLLASVTSAALLVLVLWDSLLSEVTPCGWRLPA